MKIVGRVVASISIVQEFQSDTLSFQGIEVNVALNVLLDAETPLNLSTVTP